MRNFTASNIMTRLPAYHDAALARDLAAERSEQSHQDELARRVAAYMAPGAEYDPFSKDNLSEAAGDFDTCDELFAALGTMLRQGELKAAGLHMQRASVAYWTKLATVQAQIDMDTEAALEDEA